MGGIPVTPPRNLTTITVSLLHPKIDGFPNSEADPSFPPARHALPLRWAGLNANGPCHLRKGNTEEELSLWRPPREVDRWTSSPLFPCSFGVWYYAPTVPGTVGCDRKSGVLSRSPESPDWKLRERALGVSAPACSSSHGKGRPSSVSRIAWHDGWAVLLVVVAAGLIGHLVGCSGTSGGVNPVFPIPPITGVTFSGAIDLNDVGLHPALGGFYPTVRAAVLDFSHFGISIEDDPTVKGQVGQDGKFALKEISLRDQAVLRFTSSKYPGLVLEWMGFDPKALWGPRQVRVTVRSTARSIIARLLRNRYGRRLDPESITDAEIKSTVNALLDVLEKHPEKLSAKVPLDLVPEVVAAAGAAADALAAANRGVFTREWTLLVYQGGDNSLDLAIKADLEEMLAVGPPSGTALLVQSDRPPAGIRRLWIKARGEEQVLAAIGPGNSADPRLVADFVAWAYRAFPARRFALIIASHGLGWRGEPMAQRAAGSTAQAVAGRPAAGLVTDEPAGQTIDVISLGAALNAAVTTPGPFVRPLDLLGFDACLMGLFEVAYQMRNGARYLVFSQANEPSPGWAYDHLLRAMASGAAALDGEALGRLICEAYRGSYVGEGLDRRYAGTLSLIRLDKLVDLKNRFAEWAGLLHANRATVGTALRGLRDALFATPDALPGPERYLIQAFEFIDHRDLADLVANCRSSVPQANAAADALMVAFRAAVAHTVRFGERYRRAQGLSVAFPGPGDIADYAGVGGVSAYPFLDLARETLWDDLFTELALASAAARVDGRSLRVDLTWSGGADLDLLLGEPDPQPLAGQEPIVWYSPAEGAATPNGRFSLDSAKSGLSEESWRAEATILPGRYLVRARYFEGSAVRQPTVATVRVTTLATSTTAIATVRPGEVFPAFAIEARPGAIVVERIPEPTPEDD